MTVYGSQLPVAETTNKNMRLHFLRQLEKKKTKNVRPSMGSAFASMISTSRLHSRRAAALFLRSVPLAISKRSCGAGGMVWVVYTGVMGAAHISSGGRFSR